jgi:hypothetical protein
MKIIGGGMVARKRNEKWRSINRPAISRQ